MILQSKDNFTVTEMLQLWISELFIVFYLFLEVLQTISESASSE